MRILSRLWKLSVLKDSVTIPGPLFLQQCLFCFEKKLSPQKIGLQGQPSILSFYPDVPITRYQGHPIASIATAAMASELERR